MKPHNIIEMFVRIVKSHPQRVALIWHENGRERSYTYQQLWNRIQDVAYGLERLGVHSGTKVAIYSKTNPRSVVCDLAVMALGAVSIPIDPTLSSDQMKQIIDSAQIESILIEHPDMLEEIQHLLPHMKHIALLNGSPLGQMGAVTFDTMVQLGQTIGLESYDLPYDLIQSNEIATIHYLYEHQQLKGFSYSHGNILHLIRSLSYVMEITPEDRLLSLLPYSHIMERFLGHFSSLLSGATIIHANHDKNLIQNLQQVSPTVLINTPVFFQQLDQNIQQLLDGNSPLTKNLFKWAQRVHMNHSHSRSTTMWGQIKELVANRLYLTPYLGYLGGQVRLLVSTQLVPQKESLLYSKLNCSFIELIGTNECPVFATSSSYDKQRKFITLPSTDLRISNNGELLVKSNANRIEAISNLDDSLVRSGWLATGLVATLDDHGHIQNFS